MNQVIIKQDIIEYFDIMKDSQLQSHVLVHGCNCAGVYNSGLAKQIRIKYPLAYQNYLEYLKITDNKYLLGSINKVRIGDTGIVVNSFIQRFYGRDPNVVYVDYKAIEKVFKSIALEFPDCAILYPKIGAGLANGDWNEINKIITNILKDNFNICFVL